MGRAMTKTEDIQYIIQESYVGCVLVAQSEKGICSILLGDTKKILRDDLQERYPHATISEGDAALKKLSVRVLKFIENPASVIDLPLDIRGTDYQKRVWAALRKIPVGKTASYTDIANRLKTPNAARAVAGACAANSLAIVIPCHRVVKSDGALSGYRWGVERKRRLLQVENKL
jgi:AraC family transcriptional regulator of adaptative response/methylated-DNA-[protein]-cysteine methyltransferase